ncbi:ABC transporter substrate-binding protein [Halorubrum cibi]|uniref:Branched-chain amino acid transport system substrate-binding protein n=1 Tax=Halorubrum cibi TaxID=413815 RepID=A0A521D193_9EURY|nr:ABC transporter substrate-binding protein [Halorubrum cibi]SMO64670.1 branched-chain amino acid transport system substrate-binding protein [Halorubrum cibi]
MVGLAGCVSFGGGEGSDDDGSGDGSGGDDGSEDGSGGDDGSGDGSGGDDGSDDGSDAPETISLGQPASLSGQWDFLQPGVSQATDAAVAHINEAGGPLDAELEVIRRDTAVDPQEARTVTTQLIENDGVPAIVGLFSSEINPLWDFLQDFEVPMVTPWPGSTFLDTRGGDKGTPEDLSDDEWIWRTVVGDTVHTSGSAVYALENDLDTLGVLNGTTEGERSYVEGFLSVYEDNGGTVAERVEVEIGGSSYQSALSRLFDAEFDAFLVSLPLESAITALSDWADAGYGRQPILSDPLAQQDLVDQVGSDIHGAWAGSPGQSGPSYDTFEEVYSGQGDAEINAWTPPAWDAMQVIALAIQRAGEATPEAIERNLGPVSRDGGTAVNNFAEGKEALENGEEISYQGAATPTNFTQHGNVFGSVTISTAGENGFEATSEVPAEDIREYVAEGEY